MKGNAYYIAQLIGKYLQESITPEEEIVLNSWLEEKSENKALLESFRHTGRVESELYYIRSLDTGAAWQKLIKKKRQDKMKLIMRYGSYVAAAVVLVFFSWTLLINNQKDNRVIPDFTKRYKNDVLPGGNKAVLLLSDGKSIDLEGTIDPLNEQDGTRIIGDGGEIIYEAAAQHPTNLIYNTLVVPRAGTYRMTLSDGTKVWVNALSELRFPIHFDEHERRVQIKGEVYFDVAHDPNRPFKVEVNGAHVEVLGTQFNINAYASSVTTTLVEGSVNMVHGDQRLKLSPGQQAYIRGDDILMGQADIQKATSWKDGEFYFKRDNFIEIMEQISRWYDLKVEYKGNIPSHTGYSGNISRHVNLSEVLEMLSYLSKAKFEVNGRHVRVLF